LKFGLSYLYSKSPRSKWGLLEGCMQRSKIHFSGTERIPLLNLGRAEMVQKVSKEMSVGFFVHFQEPSGFEIKEHLYPQSLGARE